METASWAEIVWSMGALIGLVCNLALLRVAVLDMRRLKRARKNGPRTLVAKGNRRNEVHRVIAQVLFLEFGIAALFTPPMPHGGGVSLQGWNLTIILAYFEVQLVWSALQDLKERRELIRLVDAMEEDRDTHSKKVGGKA